jgi:bacillithiol biosynthesis deacetylase BshB1
VAKVLIIAAHPDDAELGMGGTIAKMVAQGWGIKIVDLTDGEPTPFGTKHTRYQETCKATKILGIQERICLNMPNRFLKATLRNRRKLAKVIRLTKPDILFGPMCLDWHPDHTAAAKLIQNARFEAKFQKTKMAAAAHWTPRLYLYYSPHRAEYKKPSFIIDISEHWNKKIEAINAYKSQLKNKPPGNAPSLAEKIEIVCRYFGQSIDTKYAEPFISPEYIGVYNMDFLLGFTSLDRNISS